MSETMYIKLHREETQKTQADVAAILQQILGQSVTQGQVSRWEENPEVVPLKVLRGIAQALGRTLDELCEPPLGRDAMCVNPGVPYAQLNRNVSVLRACLDAAPEALSFSGIPEPRQVEELCQRVGRKPNVAFAGHFDAGKSRLCNAIIGEDLLPARYQPTTSAGTWLIHSDDRPAWADKQVYVYRKGFDPLRRAELDYCRDLQEAAGDFEILAPFAARRPGQATIEEFTVVVYHDAAILRACNLLDVPGNQHSAEDNRAATASLVHCDILIYVSRAQGFLDEQDLTQLRMHLRQLPTWEARGLRPLDNLLIVASHSHPGMKRGEIDSLCAEGAATLFRELSETVFAERTERTKVAISETDVRRRIFPFWFETPELREALRQALTAVLSVDVPPLWSHGADEEVESFRVRAKGACDDRISYFRAVLGDVEAAERGLARMAATEAARATARAAGRQAVLRAVQSQWEGSRRFLAAEYPLLMSEESVKTFIEKRYANKKDAEKHAAGGVIDRLQRRVGQDAAKRSSEIAKVVEDYLGQYEVDGPALLRPDGSAAVGIEFDARGTFLGGMAGIGTVGALGAWAATLGNLGGYIIVAKVASLLAALGIEVGGSAALVSLVAALGGPAVVAVVLGAIIAIGIGWLFGESWSTRLARKICKTLESNNVRQAFEGSINTYWGGTQEAFTRAADAVERDYVAHVHQLRLTVRASAESPEDLKRLVTTLERLRDFFGGLPWKASAM